MCLILQYRYQTRHRCKAFLQAPTQCSRFWKRLHVYWNFSGEFPSQWKQHIVLLTALRYCSVSFCLSFAVWSCCSVSRRTHQWRTCHLGKWFVNPTWVAQFLGSSHLKAMAECALPSCADHTAQLSCLFTSFLIWRFHLQPCRVIFRQARQTANIPFQWEKIWTPCYRIKFNLMIYIPVTTETSATLM